MAPQILYFDIRGRAEPIRLLLEDLGVVYVDRQVTLEEWASVRETTPFRRMPVYTDNDLVIPEAFAIMYHLGRTHGLLGEDERARVRCDVTVEAWRDYGNRVANTFGAQSNSEERRSIFTREEQPALLADLEAYYLARDSQVLFWAGASVTIADFAAFHLVEGLSHRFPETLERFPALQEFHVGFKQRPRIARYLTSSRRPAALFYGPNGKIFPKAT